MSNKFIVGYDGSDASKRALEYAKQRAEVAGSHLVVAYVMDWSPYSFLTPEELETRHARRKEEIERANTAVIEPVMESLKGISSESVVRYGDIAETMVSLAKEHDAVAIIVGRQGHTGIAQRIFGSTASKLAQISTVPCTIVP